MIEDKILSEEVTFADKHSKSMTGINRPFNSQHRMHIRPMGVNKSGNLFSRTTVFPKHDRSGGFSGQ